MASDGVRIPDSSSWDERIDRAYRYWLSICPRDRLPGRQHLDPLAIPRDLLPGIWLLDVQHEPFRLRYRLVGTAIVAAIGRDVTGMWLDDAHPHVLKQADFFERYRRVVATQQPSRRRGPARLWTHRDYACVENILLPFARDGRTVDLLIVYTVLFRTDRAPHC